MAYQVLRGIKVVPCDREPPRPDLSHLARGVDFAAPRFQSGKKCRQVAATTIKKFSQVADSVKSPCPRPLSPHFNVHPRPKAASPRR